MSQAKKPHRIKKSFTQWTNTFKGSIPMCMGCPLLWKTRDDVCFEGEEGEEIIKVKVTIEEIGKRRYKVPM